MGWTISCCPNLECEVVWVPSDCTKCPNCGSEIKQFNTTDGAKLLNKKAEIHKKIKFVKTKTVNEITCLNCNHTWLEGDETSFAEKLDKMADEMAKLGTGILMPWTRPMWEKEPKLRCPKCGSTVLKKGKRRLFIVE